MLNLMVIKCLKRFSKCNRMSLFLPTHWNPCWSFHPFYPVDSENGQKRADDLLPGLCFQAFGVWLEGDVLLLGGLFGTDFWALISLTRRSVNDPFHLLPSKFGIWLHHWFLLLLDEFYHQSQGERRWHFASLLCQLLFAGTIYWVQIKLRTMSFSPFQINDLGSLMRMKHQLTILWPVSRLWTWDDLKIITPALTAKMNKEATVPSAGVLREMQELSSRSTS